MEFPKFLVNIALTLITLPLALLILIARKAFAQAKFLESSL
jgi:hypothetical protein